MAKKSNIRALPLRMNRGTEEALVHWGVVLNESPMSEEGAAHFQSVRLPEGWSVVEDKEVESEHPKPYYKFKLLDDNQRVRATYVIDSQAVWPLELERRFELRLRETDTSLHFEVLDCGTAIYSTTTYAHDNTREQNENAFQSAKADAKAWCDEHFPNWTSLAMSWD